MAIGNAIKVTPIKLVNDYNVDSRSAITAIEKLAKGYGCTTVVSNLADWKESDFDNVEFDFNNFGPIKLGRTARAGLGIAVKDLTKQPIKIINIRKNGLSLATCIISPQPIKQASRYHDAELSNNVISVTISTSALGAFLKVNKDLLKGTGLACIRYYDGWSNRKKPLRVINHDLTIKNNIQDERDVFFSKGIITKKTNKLSITKFSNLLCLFQDLDKKHAKAKTQNSEVFKNNLKMEVQCNILDALDELYGEDEAEVQFKNMVVEKNLSNIKNVTVGMVMTAGTISTDMTLYTTVDINTNKLTINDSNIMYTDSKLENKSFSLLELLKSKNELLNAYGRRGLGVRNVPGSLYDVDKVTIIMGKGYSHTCNVTLTNLVTDETKETTSNGYYGNYLPAIFEDTTDIKVDDFGKVITKYYETLLIK